MDKRKQLQLLKNAIDIREYVVMMGYVIDKERDCADYAAFKNDTTGDKIYIPQKREIPNYYVNQYDEKDKGTTVDFIMSRENKNLDQARITLSEFDGSKTISKLDWKENFLANKKVNEDKKRKQLYIVKRITEKNIDGRNNPYLEQRFLDLKITHSKQFEGKILEDIYNGISRVAFPLINSKNDVVGYSFKGYGINKMIGDRKGNWFSNPTNEQKPIERVIILEHPFNGISHKQLYPKENEINTIYAATFGNPSHEQLEELNKSIKIIQPKEIIIATDNDRGGEKNEARLTETLKKLKITINTIKSQFTDYNADLYAFHIWKARFLNHRNKNPDWYDNPKKIEAPQFVLDLIYQKKYSEIISTKLRNYYVVKKIKNREIEFSFFDIAKINNDKKLQTLLST